jgi:AraC-like DNA-binding protein
VRKNKISFYLQRMQQRGHSPENVLCNTGLSVEQIGDESFRADSEDYRSIIRNMLSLTGDCHLGIALGREFNISDLGVLGYAALSSATLSQARDVIQRYNALSEYILSPSNYTCTRNGKEVWFSELSEPFPLGELLPFAVEEFVSRTIKLSASLTNRPFPVLELHLSYPPPKDERLYRETFDCPIHYNQPKNLIRLDIERLNDPITMADQDVFAICERQCQALVNEQKGQDQLSDKIKRALLKMPGSFPSMNSMAEHLGIGSRTLRRQLESENTTYQQIIDATRRELALQYLTHTSLSPKEIGYLLGYANVSNFRRAFKGWTGKKLSDYRR